MGINTIFEGEFKLDRPLSHPHLAYLLKFNAARHMKRAVEMLSVLPDPVRHAVGLPLGPEGAYCVRAQLPYLYPLALTEKDDPDLRDVLDFDAPPTGQPGLWCGWRPNPVGTAIVWDKREKFSDYVEWIEYLIEHFLKPWGYVINGTVQWESEDPYAPAGEIVVTNNVVEAYSRGMW